MKYSEKTILLIYFILIIPFFYCMFVLETIWLSEFLRSIIIFLLISVKNYSEIPYLIKKKSIIISDSQKRNMKLVNHISLAIVLISLSFLFLNHSNGTFQLTMTSLYTINLTLWIYVGYISWKVRKAHYNY